MKPRLVTRQAAFDSNMTLKDKIAGMNRRELAAAAEFRGRLLNLWGWYSPKEIYDAILRRENLSNTLAVLSRPERSVVDFLLASSGPCSIGEIGAEIRLTPEEALKLVLPLSECLLVEISPDETQVRLYPEYFSLIEVSPRNAGRLRFLLGRLPRRVLDEFAKGSNVPPSGRAKTVAGLIARFSAYDTLCASFELLAADLRATVEEIAGMGGRTTVQAGSEAEKNFVRRLTGCLPFVFVFEPEPAGGVMYTAIVPREIQTAVQCGFQQIPTGSGTALAGFLRPENRSVHRSDRYQGRAASDLIRLALLLARGEARLTQQRTISVPDIKKLQKRFSDAPSGYAGFLLELARTRRWYEFSNFISTVSSTFVSDVCSYDWKDLCLQAWLSTTARLECDHPGSQNDSAEPKAARRAVLKMLLECPEEEWLLADRLGIVIQNRHPELEMIWELSTIRRILIESLAWIGIVEVGEDAQSRPFVMLPTGAHEMIRRAVSGEMRAAPRAPAGAEAAPPIAIQPTGEIVVLDGLNTRLLLKLSAFAEPRTVDRASLFNLTRQSVLAALDHGIDPAGIVHFLEAQSGRDLPAAVRQLFGDLGAGEWRVGFAGYFVTAPSAEHLDSLIARPPSGWKLSRIAPTTAAIELQGSAAEILAGLKKAGHRAAADSSLSLEYPPRLVWKRVQTHSQLKELLLDPPKEQQASKARPSRTDILRTLDRALEYRSTVSIDYTARDKTSVQRAVLSLCDFNERKVCGYDPQNDHLEIPLGSVVDIRVSAEQEL